MIWMQLIYYVVTLVLSIALSPKPKAPRAAAIDDFDFPTAEEGRAIPVVFGEVDITGPNVLWYGDLAIGKIKKRSGFSKATVGYKYSIGFHMGLCHGPIDAITSVRWDDKDAWSGSITGNATGSINQSGLFGGEGRGGGIVGDFDVAMGAPAQAVNTYLAAKIEPNIPAYRGIVGFIWKGGYVGNSEFMKPVAIRCHRILQGWEDGAAWYPAKAIVDTRGMNPAHVIFEALTNRNWGMGVPASRINDTNFRAAADTLAAENFGLFMLWNQGSTIEQFLQIVLNHIGGGLSFRLDSGKYELVLFRGNYDPASLEEYDESEILKLSRFEKQGWGETVNEVTLVYTDPATRKPTSITAQDLGNVVAQGAKVPAIVELKGIRNHAVARDVLGRELAQRSVPLTKITFEVNRRAWNVGFGDLFKFTYTDRHCVARIFRVLKISKGTLSENAIQIEAIEDIYQHSLDVGLATQPFTGSASVPSTPASEDTTANNVISATTSAPPATPTNGDRYIVPPGATGAWSGHSGALAEWDADANAWIFTPIPDGEVVYVTSSGATVQVVGGVAAPFGNSDHGALTGLTDNDHPQYMLKDENSGPGVISGGVISAGAGGTINVTSAESFLRNANAANAPVVKVTTPAITGLALPDNALSYIYLDYNGGAPTVTASTTIFNRFDRMIFGYAMRQGSTVTFTTAPIPAANAIRETSRYLQLSQGVTRASGLITTETGTRNLVNTGGYIFLGMNEFVVADVNTSSGGTFTAYFRNGSSGWNSQLAQTQYNNLQFDDGSGTLANLSGSRYGVHWIFRCVDGRLCTLYGQAEYTLAQAQAASLPASRPPDLQNWHAVFVAKLIFQRGQATAVQIDIAFDASIGVSAASDHGSLGGLTDDDHPQYHNDARGDARYPPLARLISTQFSLTGGGDLSANRTLALVGDVASPGPSMVYGTDASGVRGWYLQTSGGAGATPSVRAHSITSSSAGSYVVGFGAAQAGDLCLIFLGGGWNALTPSGWSSLDLSTGTNWNGAVISKQLTAADITTGSVTVTMGGTFDTVVAMLALVGAPVIRGVRPFRATSGVTSSVLSPPTGTVATDLVVNFGSNRATSTDTVSHGTQLRQIAAGNASGVLTAGSGTTDAVSHTFAYSTAGTGYYEIIVSLMTAGDHGTLSGLTDDDHPQYHNDARGDARYPQLTAESRVVGDWSFDPTIFIGHTPAQVALVKAQSTLYDAADALHLLGPLRHLRVDGAPQLILARANGSINAPTAAANGDALGELAGYGASGGANTYRRGGYLAFATAEGWTASAGGTRLNLYLAPLGSTVSSTLAFALTPTASSGLDAAVIATGTAQVRLQGNNAFQLFEPAAGGSGGGLFYTGGTLKGQVGVPGSANVIITGAASGDYCIRTQGGTIRFSVNSGASSQATITTDGLSTPNLDVQCRGLTTDRSGIWLKHVATLHNYGTYYIQGAAGSIGGWTGLVLFDGAFNPVFMSNGTPLAGIFLQSLNRWIFNDNGTVTVFGASGGIQANAFNPISARDVKRETGRLSGVADILARLRPILYRLFERDRDGNVAGLSEIEQIGLVAEEVHEICPQLSNGKTVAYDRLALLLLSDWQERHGIGAR